MATANTNLRITELDFDGIKTNIKNFLKTQNEFIDYDFEGSGLSILLDILAYNTHYMGMYLNMVGNEMFLDTAQLRSSIISLAKHINYIPTSKRGARSYLDIQVTPSGAEPTTTTSLILPKYTRFFGKAIDGVSYQFLNTETYRVNKALDGTFHFTDVEITQGELAVQTYTVVEENDKRRFTIPTSNIDTSTLIVTVQESEVDETTTTYTNADDITSLTSNSTVYFLEENKEDDGHYTIYFGDGYIGKRLTNNNIVQLTYLDTKGADGGNGSRNFVIVESIGDFSSNVIVSTTINAAGGSNRETIEEVRFRAPLYYTTQNRAVTKNDYGVILLKDYPYIESVAVWGGEENDPVMYGKIFVSMKPREGYDISLKEKERIAEEIIRSRSVLTVFPEIVDPDYTYLKIEATVNYNPKFTSLTENQLREVVRNSILSYRNNNLRNFNSTFRKSVLERSIDTAEKSIISSSVDLYVQKKFEPILNANRNYAFNFLMPIEKGGFDTRLFTFPTYEQLDENENVKQVYIEEVPESYTGLDSITVTNPGESYLTVPTVTILGDGSGATATAKIINQKLASISITDRGTNYTTASVVVSGGDGFGATARANLQFRNGTLRSFYVKSTGEKIILNNNVGKIDYVTGKVTLVNFEPIGITQNAIYSDTYLTMNVPPKDDIIPPVRNRILDIDESDASAIQITMVPEQ